MCADRELVQYDQQNNPNYSYCCRESIGEAVPTKGKTEGRKEKLDRMCLYLRFVISTQIYADQRRCHP